MRTIRIGCGQGFWGDWLEAPVHLLQQGPLDFLVLDYLAEVTMSILAKQHARDPNTGYARDFVDLIARIAKDLAKGKTKIIANGGGVNPRGCGQAVLEVLKSQPECKNLKVAVVSGDNLLPEIDRLLASGETLENLDDRREFSSIRSELRSANAYLGASAVVEALNAGADIVITGRVADPCLALAPMIQTFNWSLEDWDLLAAGVVAGHCIECGAQISGGNFSGDWKSVPKLESVGYPIVEMSENGEFVVTKHAGTGGLVSVETVKEQLVYEIGDPKQYITPDVVADFTSFSISAAVTNRVKISGVYGSPRPEKLKVSCSYFAGYTASGSIVYSWPDAYEKALAAAAIVRNRLNAAGVSPKRLTWEAIGANACHGMLAGAVPKDLSEVMLRMTAFDADRRVVERFTREMAPLVLNGPPGAAAYAGGKSEVKETIAYWPSLVSRDLVKEVMELL